MGEQDYDQRPLFGPGGRIPVAEAAVTVPSGFAAVRAGWTSHHTLLVIIAAPVMFGIYRGAAGAAVSGVGWYLVLAVAGLLAGLLVAGYLPLRGMPREQLSPCVAMPAAMILAAGVLFSSEATPFTATVALALLGFAVVRRAIGVNSC